MVTAYYIMQLSNKKHNFLNHYKNPPASEKLSPNASICRICLQEATVQISRLNNSSDIMDAITRFGDVIINEHDNDSKTLCSTCHLFLKAAILFRKTAQDSAKLFKKSVKEECSSREASPPLNDSNSKSCSPVLTEEKWNNEDTEKVNKADTEYKVKQKLPNKVSCSVCNKVMSSAYYKHHMTMHDPNHQKKYMCEVCGKSFRLRCAYHNHSFRHRDDFPYKCQICPYRGRYLESLKSHMKGHSGEYTYMCNECPARFIFKTNLNSHMLKHKVPQFHCDTCKKAFHTKYTLQKHYEAEHLGIKNHVCNLCGKAFGYRNSMMKHQRNVHKREKSMFGRMPSYILAQIKK